MNAKHNAFMDGFSIAFLINDMHVYFSL